jgi:hypothetical protein
LKIYEKAKERGMEPQAFYFKNIEALEQASIEQLLEVGDIGVIIQELQLLLIIMQWER